MYLSQQGGSLFVWPVVLGYTANTTLQRLGGTNAVSPWRPGAEGLSSLSPAAHGVSYTLVTCGGFIVRLCVCGGGAPLRLGAKHAKLTVFELV